MLLGLAQLAHFSHLVLKGNHLALLHRRGFGLVTFIPILVFGALLLAYFNRRDGRGPRGHSEDPPPYPR